MITLEEFKAGRKASIIELEVLAKQLGIDADAIRNKNMEVLFNELKQAINERI